MRRQPLVSCIMIFRDAERFMDEAIASVAAQAWPAWELLLVDDGSADGSTSLARRWSASDPDRIRYLEHPGHENRGMSASRNLGVAHAAGELVAFLDADDVWSPSKLAIQVELLRAHPTAAMVYGPALYWYGWTGEPEDARRDHLGDLGVPPETLCTPPELLVQSLENAGGTMPGICSLLVHREVFARLGAFEERFRGPYEDQVFLSKVFLHAPVFVTGICTDRYRQHDASCCAQAARTGEYHPELPHPARRVFLHWLRDHLAAHGVRDRRLHAALARNLRPYDHPLVHGTASRLRYAGRLGRRAADAALRAALPSDAYHWLRSCRRDGRWVPPPGFEGRHVPSQAHARRQLPEGARR